MRTTSWFLCASSILGIIGVVTLWNYSKEYKYTPVVQIEGQGIDALTVDPAIYQETKKHDTIHTNRIDDYNCMFNNCNDESGVGMLGSG
jgi:hypothetical protein